MAINRASIAKELLPGLNAVFGIEYGSVDEEHKPLYEIENSDRAFEEEVFRQVKLGTLKFPVYLSAGQEYIASTISTFIDYHNVENKQIFIRIQAEEELQEGVFKYYVGAESNKSNADQIKSKMINLGFDGSFIVAFYKDKRISMQEALDLQLKTKNNE